MKLEKSKTVAVIVAHPDDEALWTGGTILSHPEWDLYVISLCRANDTNRAPRFFTELKLIGAKGKMGDLDDSPEQKPLDEKEVEQAILELLPHKHFDLIISHNPSGEYTRHIRHEEIGKAVIKLWHEKKISTTELWSFAYEDGNKEYYPRPIQTANIYRLLTKPVWLRKYSIITETYGFGKNSWEAITTPKAESFWQFTNSGDAMHWLTNKGIL
jgi:LmbE family N-acetylglucosaminyl deacetylase